MRRLSYIVLTLVFVACQRVPDIEMTVHYCAKMPSARASTAVAVVGDEVYVFGGRNEKDSLLRDIWRYSTTTDQWDSVGVMPMCPRVNATACAQGGKIYVGLGFNGLYGRDSSYRRDWWEYAPQTGQWKQLADYPNLYTDRAVCFREDGRLLVGYGFCWNYRRDMFRYDIVANRWDSIDVGAAMHAFPQRSFGGTGCTCGGRHFYGTGYYGGSLDWWGELSVGEDGKTGQWEERTDVPGRTRTLAAACATEKYVYLTGGVHYGGVNTTEEGLQDIRRYDPLTDRWAWVGTMPEMLMNHICFAIGKRVYFGLGETVDQQINPQLYYIEE